jgi:hypothetical protein
MTIVTGSNVLCHVLVFEEPWMRKGCLWQVEYVGSIAGTNVPSKPGIVGFKYKWGSLSCARAIQIPHHYQSNSTYGQVDSEQILHVFEILMRQEKKPRYKRGGVGKKKERKRMCRFPHLFPPLLSFSS